MKTPFVTASQLDQITATYPTPFHLYDEKSIREKARAVNQAFCWNQDLRNTSQSKQHQHQPF